MLKSSLVRSERKNRPKGEPPEGKDSQPAGINSHLHPYRDRDSDLPSAARVPINLFTQKKGDEPPEKLAR